MVGEVKGVKAVEGGEEGRGLVMMRRVDNVERHPNNVGFKDSSLSIGAVPVPPTTLLFRLNAFFLQCQSR